MWCIKQLAPFIVLMGASSLAWCKSVLPELLTKQTIENIRFISNDGRYTFYQRQSGDLALSTNFEGKSIIKGTPGTQYTMTASPERQKLAIEKMAIFHQSNNVRRPHELLISDWKGVDVKSIGQGLSLKLHLKDRWISYYNPATKEIILQAADRSDIQRRILLRNDINPYFIPDVEFLNEEEVVYTDLNTEGVSAVLYANLVTKDMKTILKSDRAGMRIDLCQANGRLYAGLFGQIGHHGLSKIVSIPADAVLHTDRHDTIYSSPLNDIGHLLCTVDNDHLYFVQSVDKGHDRIDTELASLALRPSGSLPKLLSDLENVTQIINMDGRLLIPHNGKWYVAIGKSDDNRDTLTKETPSDAKK